MRKAFVILIAIVVVVLGGVYYFLRTGVPDYSAGIEAPGLSSPVVVERNRFAVPTITARNKDDLYFAWGYVNAQDRLFQMEFNRRIGQGRIAEIAGEGQLSKDLFLRAVGFYDLSKKYMQIIDPQYRRLFQRYADGVNHYLDTKGPNIYMRLMGIKKEKWTAADPLVVSQMLNWSLAYNMKHEILYERIARKIGREKAQSLLNIIPPQAPTVVDDGLASALSDDRLGSLVKNMGWLLGSRSASNNWVIDPQKTTHGGAIMCSDMQVHNSKLPNDFYMIHVKAGDFEAAGAQVAGFPVIASGFNRFCAWGLTNQGADVIDLFKETINWKEKTYRVGGKDFPLTMKEEVFKVKGREPVKKTIYYAGRKPVLTEIFKDLGFDVSLDWSGYDGFNVTGFVDMNGAGSYDEFMNGAKAIRMSPQNMVYADREGNIAYRVIGSLPLRRPGTGNFIQDGAQAERNWDGNIPVDKYPEVKNPPRGFIATANNRNVQNYPYDLNAVYSPQYRYERIAEMLRYKNGIDVPYCKAMQTDTKSVLARKMTAVMQKHVAVDASDSTAKQAYDLVMAWDGDSNKNSAAASIYNTFYVRFAYQTFVDELGPDLAAEYVAERYISQERFLDMIDKGSDFFDDIKTPAKETVDDIASNAFNESCALLEKQFKSSNPADWRWGLIHRIKFDHVLGNSAVLRPFVNFGPVDFEGDGETNNRARFNEVAPPFIADLASAPRIIVRFDPAPKANLMLITGDNEYFLSKHNTDMIKAFLRHEYFVLDEEKPVYRMTINPVKLN